jgi:hypothetical protein
MLFREIITVYSENHMKLINVVNNLNISDTYLKWEYATLWVGDIFSSTRTSWPCSLSRTVLASTSLKMRLKFSLSTRKKWQLLSLRTMVAALWKKTMQLTRYFFQLHFMKYKSNVKYFSVFIYRPSCCLYTILLSLSLSAIMFNGF